MANQRNMKGQSVVVLGGAGFVGSHLCERLLDDGAVRVVSVDNYITGNEANVAHLRGRAGFEVVGQDITEGLSVQGPVDYVFNMASPASPIDYAKLPLETMRVGSVGTENARLLRRGQALRRGPHHGVRALARGEDAHHPHLQHLRAAHAPQ
jgi:dTDP-glucose 4,6-dehydratase